MTGNPIEALYYDPLDDGAVRCRLCPLHCRIPGGGRGSCGVRENRGGVLHAIAYSRISSSGMDPVEKKPLYHFFPGRQVLSIGSWGCNLKCQFCQNSGISQFQAPTRELAPRDLARICLDSGSIGVAYTYNEPLINFEYVRDCAEMVRNAGGKNIVVTNGCVDPGPLDALLPLVDAMNIDIKAFNEDFYRRLCKGSLAPVLETVKTAVGRTHVEVTTLLIPDANDAVPELEDLAGWIADVCGRTVPAHLTAYFPSYQMRRQAATAAHLVHARDIFKRRLDHVYAGNIAIPGGGDTACAACGASVIKRRAFQCDLSGMAANGACAACGAGNNIVTN